MGCCSEPTWGKRRTLYGRTRIEVSSKLVAALREREDGLPAMPQRQTVAQFLIHWLETSKPTIRHSTYARYEEYVRLHMVPGIGHVRLTRLSSQHVQELYSTKLAAGLSSTTVRHLHTVLHRALGQAIRWGLVSRNVTEVVDPPRSTISEHQALTSDQAKQLFEVARADSLEALYVLALMTGMRQGELLGLRWRDVDLLQNTLQIRSQLQRGGVLGETKTAKSRRQIELPVLVVDALRRHRLRQLKEQIEVGPAWAGLDLVFTNSVGNPINPSNLRQRFFLPLLKEAGLPTIRFHDLRHTSATLLLGLDANPTVVQELLGHSQIGITLDVYSHALPTMQRKAMNDLNELLSA